VEVLVGLFIGIPFIILFLAKKFSQHVVKDDDLTEAIKDKTISFDRWANGNFLLIWLGLGVAVLLYVLVAYTEAFLLVMGSGVAAIVIILVLVSVFDR
jgi:hypothetical protein